MHRGLWSGWRSNESKQDGGLIKKKKGGCSAVGTGCLSRCQGESQQRGPAFRKARRDWWISAGVKVIPSFLSLHFEITTIALALGCSAVFASLTLLLSNTRGLELT